jgi:mono/diheme cytochrome c family protein
MLHEHPLELADIKAGIAIPVTEPRELHRRKRIFWPVYGVIAALLLVGIYWFVTFEQTAIAYEEVPPIETVEVFVPLTPTPFPTAAPTPTAAAPAEPGSGTAPTTWEGGIGAVFKEKCSACHGSGTQLGGLNLSSYQSALAGGASGPGIVAGDPQGSHIIIIQSEGGHPGQLSPEELALLTNWIETGAVEK